MISSNFNNKLAKRLIYLWLLGCLCIGGFLRFYQLGGPSVWVDELNHLYAGQSLIENGSPELPSGQLYDRALIYSKLVSYSFQVLGVNEFSLRLPSAIIGLLCLVLIYFVAKRFFGVTPALLSVLFLAISPFEIGWSRISRMYTLFQFLFLLGIYTFYLGFESENKDTFSRVQTNILKRFTAGGIINFIESWNLNLIWLSISVIFLTVSYFVHQLTALFFVGILFYLALMFLVQWRNESFLQALKGKYFILLVLSLGMTGIMILVVPGIIAFVQYAVLYSPKWAAMPKFQNPKLYLDFIFDQYNFPMGVLFVLGIYQVMSRLHRFGYYIVSIFMACLLLFTFVFSYRHLQYLYNIYPILIIVSAYAFSNIVNSESGRIKTAWFKKSRLNDVIFKALIVCCFLVWIPLTPSLRLARRIPFSKDGGFNGAVFLTEHRQACNYIRENCRNDDLIISSDALGTLYYLERVDYDLNFADFDLSKEKDLKNNQGEYFDLYSGKPFLQSVSQLQTLMEQYNSIWLVSEDYKFSRAPVYVPTPIREFVLANFEKVFTTKNGTILVFHFSK